MPVISDPKDQVLPKVNRIEERFLGVQLAVMLSLGNIALACLAIFVVWFVEFLIRGTFFDEWIIARWYFPVGILVIVVIGSRLAAADQNRVLNDVIGWSAPISSYSGLKPHGKFETGTIEYDQATIGPVTISVDVEGLGLWKRGAMRAFFPWSAFSDVSIELAPSGEHKARFTVLRELPFASPQFTTAWNSEMSRYIPSGNT